ncbi:MAG: THUMP domain-containing class I SAM-dependent RNA methyltransferase [Spirochaetota bacterium]
MRWPGNGTLLATCGGGAEAILRDELQHLGLTVIDTANGAVRFRGEGLELASATTRSRVASRVLLPLVADDVSTYDELYRLARRVRWRELVPPRLSIAVSAVGRDRRIPDTRMAALKVKDAIVDAQRSAGSGRRPTGGGKRSSVDRRNPDVPVSVFVDEGRATISLDAAGTPLHMRGYRLEGGEAPLRETVAATMVLASGWDPTTPLCDPFCGSGTIAIEAAMIAAGKTPGDIRPGYAMERWPWFDARARRREASTSDTGDAERPTATPGVPPDPPLIVARDRDAESVETARRNAARAGVDGWIAFAVADALGTDAPYPEGTVVTNPPYGERLELEGARDFYAALADRLKHGYGGWDAWVLSANREAMKGFGLRASSRMQLWNGGLDARLYHYEIFAKRSS